jgi:hypothetical protein
MEGIGKRPGKKVAKGRWNGSVRWKTENKEMKINTEIVARELPVRLRTMFTTDS